MTGRRVAVEIDGAGIFQHAVQFDQADGHHGQVGHQVRPVEEFPEGAHDFFQRQGIVSLHDLVEGILGFQGPLPGVFEGVDLGGFVFTGLVFEDDVVGPFGIEGGIEIDQIDRFVRDVFPEYV